MPVRSFQLKKFSAEEDLAYLVLWAHKRGLEAPNPHYLPGSGIVILDEEGRRICASFLVLTDANFAIISGFASDPDVDKQVRSEALDLLIEALCERARQLGIDVVSGSSNNKALTARWKRHGFQDRESGLTLMMKGGLCQSQQE